MTSLKAHRHLLSLFAVLVGIFLIGTVNAQGILDAKTTAHKLVESARHGESSAARTDAAEDLFEMTSGDESRHLEVDSISEIATLLDAPDDSVRYWAARSLGNFGKRARFTIPKLKKLLSQVDCLHASKTSASGVRFALKQMGESPPRSKSD